MYNLKIGIHGYMFHLIRNVYIHLLIAPWLHCLALSPAGESWGTRSWPQVCSSVTAMAGSQDKRATRDSVASENNSTDPPASFEAFVCASLTSMSTKMDTILAGQTALEKRCETLESRVDVDSSDIKDI